MENVKKCYMCEEIKDISEFGKNKANKDGFENRCKKCRNAYAATQREKHREATNARYVEKYHNDPEFKAHRSEIAKQVNKKRKINRREYLIFNSAKQRSKKENIIFTITENDIFIPEYCPILGIKIELDNPILKYNSPSLDRIYPELGYIPENIRVISARANTMKNDATLEELELFCKNILNYMNNKDIVRTIENEESIELQDKEPAR